MEEEKEKKKSKRKKPEKDIYNQIMEGIYPRQIQKSKEEREKEDKERIK